MPTLKQIVSNPRKPKLHRKRSVALGLAPLKRGICLRVFLTKPKKPNSALRKVARVRLSNRNFITAYIPGEGHSLQEHSVVLVRGGRTQDLPGVLYKVVRGKFDCSPVFARRRARSKYGKAIK